MRGVKNLAYGSGTSHIVFLLISGGGSCRKKCGWNHSINLVGEIMMVVIGGRQYGMFLTHKLGS